MGVDDGADGFATGGVAVQQVQHKVGHRLWQLLGEEGGVCLPWEGQIPTGSIQDRSTSTREEVKQRGCPRWEETTQHHYGER